MPILHDWRLRECNYGRSTGMPVEELAATRSRYLTVPYPDGESWQEAIDRVGRFLDDVSWRWPDQRVLVIGHTATRWGLDHHLGGTDVVALLEAKFEWQPGWDTPSDTPRRCTGDRGRLLPQGYRLSLSDALVSPPACWGASASSTAIDVAESSEIGSRQRCGEAPAISEPHRSQTLFIQQAGSPPSSLIATQSVVLGACPEAPSCRRSRTRRGGIIGVIIGCSLADVRCASGGASRCSDQHRGTAVGLRQLWLGRRHHRRYVPDVSGRRLGQAACGGYACRSWRRST
jgi:hypothetical protein